MQTHTLEELRERFGFVVRDRRNCLGISQEDLAERANLHRTYVADIERGARNPSLASIDKLAKALEVPIAALFARGRTAGTTNGKAQEASGRQTLDILLVEDNPRDAELALRAFKRARLTNRVHLVRDGEEALAFLFCAGTHAKRHPEHKPRLVLLDLNLPKIDGIEVLRRLKSDKRTRDIPVVILTVSERDRDFIACRQLGADAYIVKPLDFHRLALVTPQLDFSWMLLKPNGNARSTSVVAL